MVDAELVGRMLVQIALGTPKDAFGEPLDDEASALWDQMAAEVAAIEAGGDGVEPFTPELAELPEWVEDKPEGEPPTAPEPPAGAPTLAPSAEEEPAMTATAEPAPANEARRNATLILEGTPTRERIAREFAPDALTWADLPIPLKWQEYEDDGHKGAVIVGRIDQVWREPGRLRGELVFDLDGVHGREAYRLVRGKYLRGGSILPDDITGADEELVFAQPEEEACDPELDPDCEPAPDQDGGGIEELFGPEPERIIFHAGRVRSFTLCAEPAFAEATIDDDDGDQADGAIVETGFTVALAAKVDETPWDANAAMAACSDAACYNAICAGKTAGDPAERQNHKLPHHKTPDSPPSAAGVQQALARFDQTQGLTNGPEARAHLEAHQKVITAKHEAAALVAAAHTITIEGVPPAWWYEEPDDDPPIGAVTVTDHGRLYGFLAPAFVPHRSYARQGREVHAPRGTVDYGKWQTAEALVLSADGEVERIDAGPVTMDCNHGPTHSAAAAREHYEHSCSLVATARVGENAHGTWIAGALLPGVSAEQVTRMLASSLSGHWDPHETKRGWTELTAALFVPVPGFPRRQEQARVRVRDGQLVASAIPVHYDRAPADRAAARRRRLADALALSLGRPTRAQQRAARLDAVRARVHG